MFHGAFPIDPECSNVIYSDPRDPIGIVDDRNNPRRTSDGAVAQSNIEKSKIRIGTLWRRRIRRPDSENS